MYRDAGNWKQYETVILKGEISQADIEVIMASLKDKEYFLPAQVGLETLQERWEFLNIDDHIWHELTRGDIVLTDEEPTIELTAEQLVTNFKNVSWDENEAYYQLTGIHY
jgi:hypothetical protein